MSPSGPHGAREAFASGRRAGRWPSAAWTILFAAASMAPLLSAQSKSQRLPALWVHHEACEYVAPAGFSADSAYLVVNGTMVTGAIYGGDIERLSSETGKVIWSVPLNSFPQIQDPSVDAKIRAKAMAADVPPHWSPKVSAIEDPDVPGRVLVFQVAGFESGMYWLSKADGQVYAYTGAKLENWLGGRCLGNRIAVSALLNDGSIRLETFDRATLRKDAAVPKSIRQLLRHPTIVGEAAFESDGRSEPEELSLDKKLAGFEPNTIDSYSRTIAVVRPRLWAVWGHETRELSIGMGETYNRFFASLWRVAPRRRQLWQSQSLAGHTERTAYPMAVGDRKAFVQIDERWYRIDQFGRLRALPAAPPELVFPEVDVPRDGGVAQNSIPWPGVGFLVIVPAGNPSGSANDLYLVKSKGVQHT